MTNLTDEGLRGMTRELCLKMEHEHDFILFNQSDFNYILHALQQVRDAAKKEERERCADIAEAKSADVCCGICMNDASLPQVIANAIRQMESGK